MDVLVIRSNIFVAEYKILYIYIYMVYLTESYFTNDHAFYQKVFINHAIRS